METTAYSVENNVKYLASGMFYLGFGTRHEDALLQKINSKVAEFQIPQMSANSKRGADYNLDFKKAEGQEWTNLSGYRATLKEDPAKTQYFSVYRNHGFTNKEAFNMLEGRSVCKEHVNKAGMKYEEWNKLDFNNKTKNGNFVTKKFPENHGFSLEAAFKKIDFAREMPDWSITALKKGDELSGPVLVGNEIVDVALTANPEIRAIEGRDIQGNLVMQVEGVNEHLKREQQQEAQSQQQPGETPRPINEWSKEQQQSATKEGSVSQSVKSDPVQKQRAAADPAKKAEQSKVERMPRRSHPAIDPQAQGQSRKR